VTVYDNFSRPGARANSRWLQDRHGRTVRIVRGDIRRSRARLVGLVDDADLVIHNAGQVAVTTSVQDPGGDFDINAAGTLEVLEAVRASRRRPPLIFSSTNKVYGALKGVRTRREGRRYALADMPGGVTEEFPLDFHSPYGCSKGAADQYVLDYARVYGLRTVVFRKSCVYGPRQFGVEDQGWVAWFTIAAEHGYPITIYGDGRQVRVYLPWRPARRPLPLPLAFRPQRSRPLRLRNRQLKTGDDFFLRRHVAPPSSAAILPPDT